MGAWLKDEGHLYKLWPKHSRAPAEILEALSVRRQLGLVVPSTKICDPRPSQIAEQRCRVPVHVGFFLPCAPGGCPGPWAAGPQLGSSLLDWWRAGSLSGSPRLRPPVPLAVASYSSAKMVPLFPQSQMSFDQADCPKQKFPF